MVSRLNDRGVESLRTAMKFVLDTAVSVGAQSERFPKDWLFHYRWSKGKGKGKGDTDSAEFGRYMYCTYMYCTYVNRTCNWELVLLLVQSIRYINCAKICMQYMY